MIEILYSVGGRRLLEERMSGYAALYMSAFSEPFFEGHPVSEDSFRQSLDLLRGAELLVVVLAHLGDTLVGFCCGHPLPESHGWWNALTPVDPLPDGFKAEWPGRTFAIEELGVRHDLRRKGIARQLVDQTLSSTPADRAVLSVQPRATSARKFYTHTGWSLLGRNGPLRGIVPEYWLLYWRTLRRQ